MSFPSALQFVLDHEGGFQKRTDDPGNWTGGKIGEGELKGTNFGISAASYPHEDIEHLTPERAAELYERDYWRVMRCDQMGPKTALSVMDGAVNEGVGWSSKALQEELGVEVDGVLGPETLGALARQDDLHLAKHFLALRIRRYAGLPNWRTDAEIWTLRVLDLAMLLPTYTG